jgi:AraC family ethanolamine operon transcriptional activator
VNVPDQEVATGICRRQSFALFEQVAEAAQGWELDFRQLSASSSSYWLEQFSTGGMLYSRASFGSHFHQMGGPVIGYRTFALHTNGCTDFRWCGEMVGSDALILFPAGGEFESVSKPGFDIFTVSLSHVLLERIAEIEFGRPLSGFLGEGGQVCNKVGSQLRSLRSVLHRLSNDIGAQRAGGGESLSLLQQSRFGEMVGNLVLACLDQGQSFTPRGSRSKRMKTLERAKDLIRQRPKGGIRIPNLVEQLGVSRRTLEYAFLDGVGFSPAAYLKAGRLQDLNHDLLTASGLEASVAGICKQHGFSQLGQLASDYRAMFGELPSATLRRAD